MQPNLTAAADGTVSVAFYDRRLACPAAGTKEAAAAGLALDTGLQNAGYTGPVPPFGAANYCVNTSIQFYTSNLNQASNADGFIGDYFGNITSSGLGVHVDEGTNPNHFQQQVVATVAVP